jgi:hypothetical protein
LRGVLHPGSWATSSIRELLEGPAVAVGVLEVDVSRRGLARFMLADLAMQVGAARVLVDQAAVKADRDDPDLTFAAAARCFASEVSMRSPRAVQLLGTTTSAGR